jgi:hypothetical protein
VTSNDGLVVETESLRYEQLTRIAATKWLFAFARRGAGGARSATLSGHPPPRASA